MQPPTVKPVSTAVTAVQNNRAVIEEVDDAHIAKRIASGESAAGEELVRRYQACIRSFLYAVCYDRQAVDDLAQETFLRAITAAERYDPAYPMRGWLMTIARRLSINHAEREKIRRPAAGIEPSQLPMTTEPTDRLEQEEQGELTRQYVEESLHRLSEPQRTAIVMHYQQGLPLAEIAGLLDMRLSTVKSHLHRGRKRMRELLTPHAERLMP